MTTTTRQDSFDRRQHFIDGEWTDPADRGEIVVVDPATTEQVGTAPDASVSDIDRAVAAARNSFDAGEWRNTPGAERALILNRAADLIEARGDELADVITHELGCTLAFTWASHVPSPIRHLRFYASLAARSDDIDYREDGVNRSAVVTEPVGVVAAITPWNGPLSSPMLKAAPALATGCSIVLKPSPEAPLGSFFLADALAEAGLPAGVFNLVPGGREAGQHLVSHPEVDKVAFTGSTAAGRAIMAACAERIARITLELGGKSAAVILDDVDIDVLVAKLLPLSTVVNGQACIAQTRILAPQSRYAEIVEALGSGMKALKVGDPFDDDTRIGPLVSEAQRQRVEGYIAIGRSEGARVVTGGGRPADLDRGWYVEPTVFADVDNSMRIAREEIFGPVIGITPYDTDVEAVAIANDSIYGLSGSVWSNDPERAMGIARGMRTGMVSINGAPQATGTPFGGFKQSGIGREMSAETLQAYLERKTIAVGPAQG